MHVDLAKLRHLLAVARTGSFRRAAEELGVTQPALSRNIALIEGRFGFRIFERGRGGAKLTPVGALVVQDAESLVRHAAVLERNLDLYGRGESGQIAFGMGPQIASVLLPKLGAHMLTTRPQLRMRCLLKTADVLMRELHDDAIEMMFCASNHVPPSPEIVIEPIGGMTYGMLARSGHPLAAKESATMSDLAGFPLALDTERPHPVFPTHNGALICDNAAILREAVFESDALWFASHQTVANDIASGRLVELKVVDLPFSRIEVGVVRLTERASSPAASAITAYARKLLAEPEPRTSASNVQQP
jgi:DNA-binding transcriptional LysR family regulator